MVNSYVVYDLETTGLSPLNDSIIEIGALLVKDGEVESTFSRIVNPHFKISSMISNLTGITNELLAGGEEKEDVIKDFLDFCGEEVIMGHNLNFDYKFMKVACNSLGLPFEKKGIDTLKIAKKVLQGLESRSLDSMCRYYNVVNESAHRALFDAKATYLIYEEMKKQFIGTCPAAFEEQNMVFKVPKYEKITPKQKRYLNDLIKYHKIKSEALVDELTKSEASKEIDRIILQYGMIK